MRYTDIIQKWFRDEWGGSLVLPDGWYGRPYDNQHGMTSIHESGDALTVTLDQKLTLHFEGLKSVRVRKRELVFGPFDKLRFEWEAYGASGEHGVKEYRAGEARIVPAPG
jgi:hypothetical protein